MAPFAPKRRSITSRSRASAATLSTWPAITILPVDCTTTPRTISPLLPVKTFLLAMPPVPNVVSSVPSGPIFTRIDSKSSVASAVAERVPAANTLPAASTAMPKMRSWPFAESGRTIGLASGALPSAASAVLPSFGSGPVLVSGVALSTVGSPPPSTVGRAPSSSSPHAAIAAHPTIAPRIHAPAVALIVRLLIENEVHFHFH